jgi:hypothetical protein
MNRLATLSALLVVAAPTLTSTTASARPRVRDHRTESAEPAPRTDAPPPRHRHRKRPGPKVMLPLRFDVGATSASTSDGFRGGVEMKLGVHWASLSPTPTRYDVGLGVFGAVLPGAEDAAMPEVDNDVLYGGAYLEAGKVLSEGRHWRTWAAGRGEYLGTSAFGENHEGFGVAGRLGAELYLSGVGIEPRGLFLGTYAIGVYAEASARDLGGEVSPMQVSGGLTLRTPLVFMPW